MRLFPVLIALLALAACDDAPPASAGASCDGGPPHARDLLPPDETPPATFAYQAYASAQPTGGAVSSVSYVGSATVTPSAECEGGERRLVLTGAVQAARTADGGAPEQVSGQMSLVFRVTDTEITATYADPFTGPDGGVVVGPFPREAASSGAETHEAAIVGCGPNPSSVRLLPGGGLLSVMTACTAELSAGGTSSSGATLTVLD